MQEVVARPGLRERQRTETRALIRRTAVALATEHGVSAVSVQSISDAAGISPRTFFNHFRSKDEALVPDLPDFSPQARQAFLDGVEPDLLTALEALLSGHVAAVHEQAGASEGPQAVQRLLRANPELVPRVMVVLESFARRLVDLVAQRTGRAPEDLACAVAASTAIAAVWAAFGTWCRAGADECPPVPTLVPSAFSVLRELLTPAARPS